MGINFLIDTMKRGKKNKRKSKRGNIRKSKVTSGRKTVQHQSRTKKMGHRKKTGSRKTRARNQKGGSDFFMHLLSGLTAGAAAGLEAHAKENRKKWLEKNKKQN